MVLWGIVFALPETPLFKGESLSDMVCEAVGNSRKSLLSPALAIRLVGGLGNGVIIVFTVYTTLSEPDMFLAVYSIRAGCLYVDTVVKTGEHCIVGAENTSVSCGDSFVGVIEDDKFVLDHVHVCDSTFESADVGPRAGVVVHFEGYTVREDSNVLAEHSK